MGGTCPGLERPFMQYSIEKFAVPCMCGLFVYLQMALGIVKCDSGHEHGPFVTLP